MSKITVSAKGEDCQVRIPGVCSFDPAKTVFAHKNGAGMALKYDDIIGAYCCSPCHSVIDGGTKSVHSRDDLNLWFYEGIFRTQLILKEKGLIRA